MPLQDGKDLVLNKKITTVTGLQSHPIQIHLNPRCEVGAKCRAQGRYINEDGLVPDLEKNINNYTIDYNHNEGTAPPNLNLLLSTHETAQNYPDYKIN